VCGDGRKRIYISIGIRLGARLDSDPGGKKKRKELTFESSRRQERVMDLE